MRISIEQKGGLGAIEVQSDNIELLTPDGTKIVVSSETEVDMEAAMASACAELTRKNSKPWRPASEWAKGEPPRDGRFYKCEYHPEGKPKELRAPMSLQWRTGSWRPLDGSWFKDTITQHNTTPVSEWVDGEPPRDGQWYVARTGSGLNLIVRWHDGRWRDATGDMLVFWVAYLPTPIPER